MKIKIPQQKTKGREAMDIKKVRTRQKLNWYISFAVRKKVQSSKLRVQQIGIGGLGSCHHITHLVKLIFSF